MHLQNARNITEWATRRGRVGIVIKRWKYEETEAVAKVLAELGERSFAETWCYYLWLHEVHCKDFDSLWLEDKIMDIGGGLITHDYIERFEDLNLHGGVTYYAKHHYKKGHRRIEIGCDFSHFNDLGKIYTLEEVAKEAEASASQASELYLLPDPKLSPL